jgi:hypothetical protein
LDSAAILIVAFTNLLFGAGLLVLGLLMLRRPDRVWVGFRVPRDPERLARTRAVNLRTGWWIAALGITNILSGPIGYLTGIHPLALAGAGLTLVLIAIVSLVSSAFISR